jgi:hypothetical protein
MRRRAVRPGWVPAPSSLALVAAMVVGLLRPRGVAHSLLGVALLVLLAIAGWGGDHLWPSEAEISRRQSRQKDDRQ